MTDIKSCNVGPDVKRAYESEAAKGRALIELSGEDVEYEMEVED